MDRLWEQNICTGSSETIITGDLNLNTDRSNTKATKLVNEKLNNIT